MRGFLVFAGFATAEASVKYVHEGQMHSAYDRGPFSRDLPRNDPRLVRNVAVDVEQRKITHLVEGYVAISW